MNQESIETYLNELLEGAESELDAVFLNRLKEMKRWLSALYEKYPDPETNGISRTEIYKYRRFEKEMDFIKQNIQEDYKTAYALVFGTMTSQYIENYVRSGYVYEMTTQTDMEYEVPGIQMIREVLENPIKELKLNSILNNNRNQTIRKLRIEIAQGIEGGESYSKMAKRLENVFNFSRHKARTVARTEAGKAQTMGRIKSAEKASNYGVKMTKTWFSERDKRVRQSHQKVDGQKAGKDGMFRYKGNKAIGPSLWIGPDSAKLSINCRCDVLYLVNGEKPDTMRVRDYDNLDYQKRLAERIEQLMADEGLTEKQATKKANKQIRPPSKVQEFMDYETWRKSLINKG